MNAGTSLPRAYRTAMAIPQETVVEGRPPYPPTSRRSARASPRAPLARFGTCTVGVVSYAGRRRLVGSSVLYARGERRTPSGLLRPQSPPQGCPAYAQPTGRLRQSPAGLSEGLAEGLALLLGPGPAVRG